MNIENVWQAYSSRLRVMLKAKLSDPDDVEDLLQEILIKTHRNIGNLRTQDKLKPWLFQVANNVVIDFYRRRGAMQNVELGELWYEQDQSDVERQMSTCIVPFVQALPSKTAELIYAIDIEGRSQKEYAAELGISYSTLKSRVQRGRLKLREAFEQCCHLELDRQGRVVEYRAKLGRCEGC